MSALSSAETIGERLKRLRLERGLSQRDLASPGVSYAYISRVEAGERTPSVKALRKLAERLCVSVEQLEHGSPDEIERALKLVGLSLAEITAEERVVVERVARIWRLRGAYNAAVELLEARAGRTDLLYF